MPTTSDAIRDNMVLARDQMREDYERRMAAIEAALAAYDGGSVVVNGNGISDHTPRSRGISPEKFKMVREYMRKHKRAVQVQIAKDLSKTTGKSFNSGSVSVALGKMLKDGEVKQDGKEKSSAGYSSQVWEWTGEDDGLPSWAVRPDSDES